MQPLRSDDIIGMLDDIMGHVASRMTANANGCSRFMCLATEPGRLFFCVQANGDLQNFADLNLSAQEF